MAYWTMDVLREGDLGLQEKGQKDVKKEDESICTVLCDFFDNLIKCTKKPFLKILTIHELNINMDG